MLNLIQDNPMPLIALYSGEDFVRRFSDIEDAFKTGREGHSVDKPAKVEVTPDAGGPITIWRYDALAGEWNEVAGE